MFKKLIVLLILVGIGYGALWAWQSPYFALHQIDQGLNEKDPVRVERYVDLEALVKAAVEVSAAIATEELGVGGKDLGSAILGSLVGAVAKGVGEAASVEGAMELRRAIQRGNVSRALGPFVVDDGWRALGGIQKFDASALVTLNGKCEGNDATIRVMFEEREGDLALGYPKKWVLVGVDKESLQALGKTCRRPSAPGATSK
jgi:hypothetical protein